jgi:hypothetical protein
MDQHHMQPHTVLVSDFTSALSRSLTSPLHVPLVAVALTDGDLSAVVQATEAEDKGHGIDWWAVQPDGTQLGVDIKQQYGKCPPYIPIETWSNFEAGIPGPLFKTTTSADYWVIAAASRPDVVVTVDYASLRDAAQARAFAGLTAYTQATASKYDGPPYHSLAGFASLAVARAAGVKVWEDPFPISQFGN